MNKDKNNLIEDCCTDMMRKPYIKHENLRKALEEIYFSESHDGETFERFENELKHSCLIVAADMTESSLNFRVHENGDEQYGVLFSDMDEFNKTFSNDECESHSMDFLFYQLVISEGLLDGFVLNPESECLLLKRELFLEIDDLPEHQFNNRNAFSTGELKKLRDSIDNSDLEKFVRNPNNLASYEELFEKISGSTLLTLMLSRDDLTEYASDGIISQFETGPLGFLYIDEVGGNYATVYTSESKMCNVQTPFNKYSQIVNFSQMTNFVLNDDMDGIIINPNAENIILSRDILLEYSSLLEKTCNDSRLNAAIFHMFLIEEDEGISP